MSLIAWSCAWNIEMPPIGCGFLCWNEFLYNCCCSKYSLSQLYSKHVTFSIKALSSLNVSLSHKYFTQTHQREHSPPIAVTSRSSCSIDGTTDTDALCISERNRHDGFLVSGHWGRDLESPDTLAVESSETAAQFLFTLSLKFRAFESVGVVMFACLSIHLNINYSYSTNTWRFSLGMMALLFFLSLMPELYFKIFFSHLPSIFLLQQFERVCLDTWLWWWAPIYNYAVK